MSQQDAEADDETAAETPDPEDGRPAFVRDVVSGRLNGTVVDPDSGDRLEAVFKDPTDAELAELELLEERAMADLDEAGDTVGDPVRADRDFGNRVIEDFTLEITDPDSGRTYAGADLGDGSEYPMGWKQSITVGFLKAVGADNEALKDAESFFEERMDRLGGNG